MKTKKPYASQTPSGFLLDENGDPIKKGVKKSDIFPRNGITKKLKSKVIPLNRRCKP